jgi:hypothetical protein
MGNKNTKLVPSNKECPICLANSPNKMFILNCNHQFDIKCLQYSCENYLTSKETIKCPICRTKILQSELSNIFNKGTYYIQNNPDFWSRNDIVLMQSINYFDIKFVFFEKIINNNKILMVVPQYFHNFIYQPLFIQYKLNNIEETNHIIKTSLFNGKSINDTKNGLNKITLTLKGSVLDHQWFNLLNSIINSKYLNIVDKSNLKLDLLEAKKSLNLIISDDDNIITYDQREGTMNPFFELINRRQSSIIFMPLFLIYENKIYSYNRLHQIMYT